MMGKKPLTFNQPEDKLVTVTLKEVYFIPSFHWNQFSITAALTCTASLENEKVYLVLKKQNTWIVFDQIIKSLTGYLVGIKTKTSTNKLLETIGNNVKIELNHLHKQLGHPN